MSGLRTHNIREEVTPGVCGWYQGPSLLDTLDQLPLNKNEPDGSFLLLVTHTPTLLVVSSGAVRKGQNITVLPSYVEVVVDSFTINGDVKDGDGQGDGIGENVELRLGNVQRRQFWRDSVLCDPDTPVTVTSELVVRARVLAAPRAQRLIAPGYRGGAIIHLGTAHEECRV